MEIEDNISEPSYCQILVPDGIFLNTRYIKKAGLREGFAPNLSTQSGAKCEDFVSKPRKFWSSFIPPLRQKSGICCR